MRMGAKRGAGAVMGAGAAGGGGSRRDTALVGVDRVRGGAHADEREAGDGAVHGDGELTADGDGGRRQGVDDRAGRLGAGRGEEIGWLKDLSVIVVLAASVAETASTDHDRRVRHEETDTVVVTGHGHGGHDGPL